MENINERIELFRTALEGLYQIQYGNTQADPKIELEYGKKYVRVVVVLHDTQRSAYCFINQENGDILKAASWKAPAKGKRGSIFNENCDVGTRANMHGGGLYAR